jgi:hypothetical protein
MNYTDEIQRLCACGCGNYVSGSYINRTIPKTELYGKRIERRFIHGHSNTTKAARIANSIRKKGNVIRLWEHDIMKEDFNIMEYINKSV